MILIVYLVIALLALAFFYSARTLNEEYDKRIAQLLEKENEKE
jgi:hypothetical protein